MVSVNDGFPPYLDFMVKAPVTVYGYSTVSPVFILYDKYPSQFTSFNGFLPYLDFRYFTVGFYRDAPYISPLFFTVKVRKY